MLQVVREKPAIGSIWDSAPPALPIKIKTSLASVLNVQSVSKRETNDRPTVVGHRGSLYKYPENTIRSFIEAYEAGCDAIELDVFLLKCGTLVVFHGSGTDEEGCLKNYCNIDGTILDYTAEEARELLHFNPHFAELACPKERLLDREHAFIPTLEEVLLTFRYTNMKIIIELKGPDTTVPVLKLVESLSMVDQCFFSSFALERVALLRQLRPQKHSDGSYVYKTGALFKDGLPDCFVEISQEIGASEVHLKYDTCSKDRVDRIHAAGMGSMCWFRGPIGMKEDIETKYYDIGNEDTILYDIVMRTGVQGMFSNKPDVLIDMLCRTQ